MRTSKKKSTAKESSKGPNTNTKKGLIQSISQEKGIHPSDVRHVIQAFLDKMTERLKAGERVEFRDFGIFEVVIRKEKVGRNPRKADEPIIIPTRCVVKFTPGKRMRSSINGALAQLEKR